MPADALTVGDQVRQANGDAVVVQRVTFRDRPQTMYNLTSIVVPLRSAIGMRRDHGNRIEFGA